MNEIFSILPMIPLRGIVLYPKMVLHFDIGRPSSIAAAEHAMRRGEEIFLAAQRDARTETPMLDEIYPTGTVARVRQILRLPGDDVRVMVEGIERARLTGISEAEKYRCAEIERIGQIPAPLSEPKNEVYYRQIQELLETYLSLSPGVSPDIIMNVMSSEDIGELCDYIAQNLQLRYQVRQRILELAEPAARAEAMCEILAGENEILSLTRKIHQKVRQQMDRNQRDYYLREQIRAIEEELGEDEYYDEPEEDDGKSYISRIKKLGLPEESEEHLIKEARRLSRTQPTSPENNVISTYLDTVLELPWNKYTRESRDLKAAQRQLDRDHYGMEKVKERILEFMAVRALNPDLRGQVLCLIGPPGVGKTSVGISIAKALGRNYARLSLGGVRDEADIRGHRKTYVGAMPGRIMTALSQAGSMNALLLLDEVDKLGADYRGDPSSALLEVLDTAQNHAFRDHFIEIPFDLSDVMFVCTANYEEHIPSPLLDRMEVIEMPGYTDEEKLHIAKEHLFPRQLSKHGLKRSQLHITDAAYRGIIADYTREAGVRQLEREIAKLCRRTARVFAEQPEHGRVNIGVKNLKSYLGVALFQPDNVSRTDECGIVNGLAWTAVGGEMLEVEVNIVPGSGHIELTGNLGDVMKESARAGISFIRSCADKLGIDPDFYKTKDMHIHFPEGAIPKDGPSAGITITTALVSALSGRPVRHDVAMTGEITLRGRVLPIGGLREKTMAAFRAGIKTVIIPEANLPNLEDIVPAVREGLTFVPARHMETVLEAALLPARE